MKRVIFAALVLCVVGCSATDEKSNAASICTDNSGCKAAAECLDGACVDHQACTAFGKGRGCIEDLTHAEVNGVEGCFSECGPNGECDAPALCRSGLCISDEPDSGAAGAVGCTVDWECEDDGKTYSVRCAAGECSCGVNDVADTAFASDAECVGDTFHREVNAGCGWTVPAL